MTASACTAQPAGRPGPTLMQMARTLGTDVVTALRRGYVEGRSGEILVIAEPWNVLGQWNGGLRGAADPRTTHSSPWSYHQQVPLALYGPGYIREGGRVDRSVTVADVAPTLASILGIRFDAEGAPLREALVPAKGREPPRAIVVVVVDGGGWNVLERWPDAWPTQRRLMEDGTTYTNATIGSAPSVTAPVHATIGTGTYPATHGIAENTGRLPNGEIDEVTHHEARLDLLEAPTVADAWDRANHNDPWVGLFGFESWHLPMMGPGMLRAGNDRDVGVLWDRESPRFWTNERYYMFPPSLPGRDRLDERIRELDAADGALDGRWERTALDPGEFYFPATPAFVAFQGDAVVNAIRTEGIGTDRLTDLLFVEMKSSDIAGHVWNMRSPQAEAVLEAQDRSLDAIVAELDARVGRGKYVMVMTADHGQSPIPEDKGGLRIDRYQLHDDLNGAFDDAVEAVHPSDVFLDPDGPAVSLEEMARFIGAYRYSDGLPEDLDEGSVPPEVLDRRVFAAALPGRWLAALTAEQVEDLGPGEYPEGDLTSPPRLLAFDAG